MLVAVRDTAQRAMRFLLQDIIVPQQEMLIA
jgi:hypothetical protein